ncbi:Transcriptional regulator, AcrR family [hydrothermal vent metagenome]|uniref:Transcriptional regulator, AcrR family n=1 Tax=hydrothermal vent metagenome TaxID=652676 RepID=A0A3B0YMP0_9ZZZZ
MGNKAEALRQRIVIAADQLFYHQGYESTSFTDIANAVNISRGNFYYHFKTKDEILTAVINHRTEHYQLMLRQWEEDYSQPKQRILLYLNILTTNQDSIKNHGCPVGSLCTEMAKVRHTILHDASQVLVQSRDWLSRQFEQLGLNQPIPLAMHLLARIQGIATITNAFEDKEFLCQEVKKLIAWLDDICPT